MSADIDIDRPDGHDRRAAAETTDLDALIELFATNLRILKGIDTDSDRHMAGRIEELESTIRTLESLRDIASMPDRIDDEPGRHPCKAERPDCGRHRRTRTPTRPEDCTRTRHTRRHS